MTTEEQAQKKAQKKAQLQSEYPLGMKLYRILHTQTFTSDTLTVIWYKVIGHYSRGIETESSTGEMSNFSEKVFKEKLSPTPEGAYQKFISQQEFALIDIRKQVVHHEGLIALAQDSIENIHRQEEDNGSSQEEA